MLGDRFNPGYENTIAGIPWSAFDDPHTSGHDVEPWNAPDPDTLARHRIGQSLFRELRNQGVVNGPMSADEIARSQRKWWHGLLLGLAP